MDKFVHLHLHSHYSLLDGAIKIDDIVDKAIEFDMSAVAVTDHGNMFGAIEFFEKASNKGLKPIIGCELYVAKNDMSLKNANEKYYNHLILLAKNEEGYQNLSRLVSKGYTDGFYYKPRIDKNLLKDNHKGLIALSACIKGEIPQHLLQGRQDAAEKSVLYYLDLFKDDFYLEMQVQGIREQVVANEGLIELSKKFGVPVVATNDCHYLLKDDYEAHDVLLCIQTGKTVDDKDRMRFSTKDLYFRSQEEMIDLFSSYPPEAISNTKVIQDKCNFGFKLKGEHHFPQYKIADKSESILINGNEKSAGNGQSDDDILVLFEKEVREGFNEIFISNPSKSAKDEFEKNPEIYKKRLDMEIEVIKKSNFAGYFLIVSDFIKYAKKHDIPVGPGRGSAAGSLVAYSLQITAIDPIKYGLMFERFLNPERISMPDIDSDFCINGRDEVIRYVSQKYGEANVSQIITFGTMLAKAVIRDTGRALNMPYAEVDKIAKLVPNTLGITLEEAIKEEPKLQSVIDSEPKVKKLIEIAKRLEGLARHASTHAAGVVISNKPIMNYMPLYKGTKETDVITTQYTGQDIEKLGFIKFDFLGLKTLTVMNEAIKLINDTNRLKNMEAFNIYNIDLNDPKTLKLLAAGDTTGVFQLESSGMKELVKKLAPSCFEDLIPLVALYRPGPLRSGMVDDFIMAKHGKVSVHYMHPFLENIVKETYGVILYQEQIMRIAVELAGFSMKEADVLRKGVGKKQTDLIMEMKEKFIAGCNKNGIENSKSDKIFSLIVKFGEYGFNKSHSAAYAYIAYMTAYLKANYKEHFTAALLSSEMSNTDKLTKIIEEANSGNNPVYILPPSVNDSMERFAISHLDPKSDKDEIKGEIRYEAQTDGVPVIRIGLGAVKNVGTAAIDSILQVRKESGLFKGLLDFCSRVDTRRVNKRTIENLIKCGALDNGIESRKWMLENLENVMEEADREREKIITGQFELPFFSDEDSIENENQMPLGSVFQSDIYLDDKKFLLACEKESLGFYLSGHPLDGFEEKIKAIGCSSLRDIVYKYLNSGKSSESKNDKYNKNEDLYTFCGVISQLKIHKTKNNDKMASFVLNDKDLNAQAVFFPKNYVKYEGMFETDEPVILTGRIDFSELNLDNYGLQNFGEEEISPDDIDINIKIIGEKIEYLDSYKIKEIKHSKNADKANSHTKFNENGLNKAGQSKKPEPSVNAANNLCIIEIKNNNIFQNESEFINLMVKLKNDIDGSKGDSRVRLRFIDSKRTGENGFYNYEIDLKENMSVNTDMLKSKFLKGYDGIGDVGDFVSVINIK